MVIHSMLLKIKVDLKLYPIFLPAVFLK